MSQDSRIGPKEGKLTSKIRTESECVVRVVDGIGLQVDLTADAKYSQAELVGFATILLLWWRFVTDHMSIFGFGNVPGNNIRVC